MAIWNPTRSHPIGLDVAADCVRMMQLGTDGQSLAIEAATRVPFPIQGRLNASERAVMTADAIHKGFAQQSFSGRRVVAALPRELVHVKNLRLPMMSAAELELAVRFEARTVFPFDTDEARIEFLPAGEVRQGSESRQEVIVLGVKNGDIEDYLQQLDRWGLDVAALDTEMTAVFRSFERFVRRKEDEAEAQMLVDIGPRRTQVIIGKGRDLSFYKPIEIGSADLGMAVSKKVGITIEEADAMRRRWIDECWDRPVDEARGDAVRIAVSDAVRAIATDLGRELAMCQRYFSVTFRGNRVGRVRVVGPEAGDPQLRATLESALGLPVEAGRPLSNMDTTKMRPADRRGPMSEWTLATGMALRFIPGYFAAKDGRPRQPMVPTTDVHEITPEPGWEVARA